MDYLVTFLEGIVTFVSPCLLPMVPIYLAYVAGDANAHEERDVRRTVVGALFFVLGFALVFTVLGAFAGTLGGLLVAHRRTLDAICGAIVIVLGLNYLGVVRIPALDQTLRPALGARHGGALGPLLFGMVFALGWTPCVGTFLASALSLAAASGSALPGVLLLLAYSAGLGLPFVLCAVLIDQLEGTLAWLRTHGRLVEVVSGSFLVLMGVLMATGMLGAWLSMLAG